MRSSTQNNIHYALWVVCLALYGLGHLQLLPETVLWPAMGVVILVDIWLWTRTRLRYVDYVLVPLKPEELPKDTYELFNRWTPEFMAFGCGLVGDFQLSYRPWPTYVRYFLPQDRRIKGEVSQADAAAAPSFTTIFDDGRMLETAIFDQDLTQFGDERKLWMQCAHGVSVEELYAMHQRSVDLYESTYGAKALTVTPDRLLDFAQYGHRLVWWERKELPASYGIPQVPVGPMTNDQVSMTNSASGR